MGTPLLRPPLDHWSWETGHLACTAQGAGDQVSYGTSQELPGFASQPPFLASHLDSHRAEQLDRLRPSCQIRAVLTATGVKQETTFPVTSILCRQRSPRET